MIRIMPRPRRIGNCTHLSVQYWATGRTRGLEIADAFSEERGESSPAARRDPQPDCFCVADLIRGGHRLIVRGVDAWTQPLLTSKPMRRRGLCSRPPHAYPRAPMETPRENLQIASRSAGTRVSVPFTVALLASCPEECYVRAWRPPPACPPVTCLYNRGMERRRAESRGEGPYKLSCRRFNSRKQSTRRCGWNCGVAMNCERGRTTWCRRKGRVTTGGEIDVVRAREDTPGCATCCTSTKRALRCCLHRGGRVTGTCGWRRISGVRSGRGGTRYGRARV